MKDKVIYGGDFFIPMLLILIKTFFTTPIFPFVSDEKYMHSFANNFVKASDELFSKFDITKE